MSTANLDDFDLPAIWSSRAREAWLALSPADQTKLIGTARQDLYGVGFINQEAAAAAAAKSRPRSDRVDIDVIRMSRQLVGEQLEPHHPGALARFDAWWSLMVPTLNNLLLAIADAQASTHQRKQ